MLSQSEGSCALTGPLAVVWYSVMYVGHNTLIQPAVWPIASLQGMLIGNEQNDCKLNY